MPQNKRKVKAAVVDVEPDQVESETRKFCNRICMIII